MLTGSAFARYSWCRIPYDLEEARAVSFTTAHVPPLEVPLGNGCETEFHGKMGYDLQIRFASSDRIAQPRIGMGSQP